MRAILAGLFVLFLLPAAAPDTEAACVCRCVDGKIQPVCDRGSDLRPRCTKKFCPVPPPSAKPVAPKILPPVGTKSCAMRQVMDPKTRRYAWQRVCE